MLIFSAVGEGKVGAAPARALLQNRLLLLHAQKDRTRNMSSKNSCPQTLTLAENSKRQRNQSTQPVKASSERSTPSLVCLLGGYSLTLWRNSHTIHHTNLRRRLRAGLSHSLTTVQLQLQLRLHLQGTLSLFLSGVSISWTHTLHTCDAV